MDFQTVYGGGSLGMNPEVGNALTENDWVAKKFRVFT